MDEAIEKLKNVKLDMEAKKKVRSCNLRPTATVISAAASLSLPIALLLLPLISGNQPAVDCFALPLPALPCSGV